MTDLFAAWHTDAMIDQIFAVMALAHRHTFIITTKEASRMHDYMLGLTGDRLLRVAFDSKLTTPKREHIEAYAGIISGDSWPLSNVWLGVSVEDQKNADERVSQLVATPAAVRWISAEPLLEQVDFQSPWSAINPEYPKLGIHWVVVGGESGPGARPMHPDWARFIRDQCLEAGVSFFFKQWGAWQPVCALYPVSETELDEHERAGCCGDIELQTNGVIPNGYQPSDPRTWLMDRVGKKEAGRTLDGCQWNQFPV